MIRLARITALLLVAPFLTFASALAPQHVHESGPGHDHAVAHSHFAPHDGSLHHSNTAEIEHDDAEHIVWLDSTTLHETPFHLAYIVAKHHVAGEVVVPMPHWSVTAIDDAAPPHGPPRPVDRFRGPPARLV